MVEDSGNLRLAHAGEPRQELIHGRAVVQVLEERRDGHARAAEDPHPARARRTPLNLGQLSHPFMLSPPDDRTAQTSSIPEGLPGKGFCCVVR